MMNSISRNIFCLLLIFASLMARPSLQAQDFLLESTGEISVSVALGGTSHFSTGAAQKGIQSLFMEYAEPTLADAEFSTRKMPKLRFVWGASANYQWKDQLSFSAGIRWNQRGYNIGISGEIKDQEYQFDQLFDYTEKYRVNTFEVPLSATFHLSDRFNGGVGFLLGFASQKTSRVFITQDQSIIVNGERVDDLSVGLRENETPLTEVPNKVFAGVFVELTYQVFPHLFLGTTAQRTSTYAKLNYGNLADYSALLFLRYTFSIL